MQKNNDKNLEKTVDNIDVFDEKNGVQEDERDVDNAQIVRLDDDCDEKNVDNVDEEKTGGILADYATRQSKGKIALAVVKKYCKRYFIDAFSGMAQGLFCTLIAGTILAQIASWCGDNSFAKVLGYIASIAKMLMGAGIGIGIAHKLGAKPLVIFTAAVTGLVGAFAGNLVGALCGGASFTIAFGAVGTPVGAYDVS